MNDKMTRQEFLKISWNKYLKPVIIGILLVYALNFLVNAITTKGSERNFLFVVIMLSIAIIVLLILNLIATVISDWVKSKTPESIKYALRNTNKVLGIVSPFIALWFIYQLYVSENHIGMIIAICYLIQEIWQIWSKRSHGHD